MGIVGRLVPPETGKVRVGIAVETEGVVRIKDEATFGSSSKVLGNAFESHFVGLFGSKGVAGALVDGEGDVRTAVSREVEEHADNAGVVDETGGRCAVSVLRERGCFSGRGDWVGVFLADAASVNDLFGEAWLGQRSLVARACDVDTKEAFGSTLTAQLEIVVLEVGNEGGNEGLIGGPNEQVINVDNDNDLRAQEETGVTRGGLKTLALEAFREVVEEVSACLFEPINRTVEAHHAIVAAHEATGLMYVDLFFGG